MRPPGRVFDTADVVRWKSPDVSEERAVSIFRYEVKAKKEMSMEHAFNGLHSVISQKTELFITSAVRTPNPAFVRLYVWVCG
jgi:hypothetical protein